MQQLVCISCISLGSSFRIHKLPCDNCRLGAPASLPFMGGELDNQACRTTTPTWETLGETQGTKGRELVGGLLVQRTYGGAPASTSSGFHTPLAWQNTALEEESGEEPKLVACHQDKLTNLQEAVGNLVLLLDSFHKGDPSSFELEEKKRACRAKLSKGAKQEDP